jgi:abortive infection bacteriophage resistance protein
MFDRNLRLVLLDAIERIEVSVRTKIAYLHAIEFGPFGHADDSVSLREQAETVTRTQFLERVQQDTSLC